MIETKTTRKMKFTHEWKENAELPYPKNILNCNYCRLQKDRIYCNSFKIYGTKKGKTTKFYFVCNKCRKVTELITKKVIK